MRREERFTYESGKYLISRAIIRVQLLIQIKYRKIRKLPYQSLSSLRKKKNEPFCTDSCCLYAILKFCSIYVSKLGLFLLSISNLVKSYFSKRLTNQKTNGKGLAGFSQLRIYAVRNGISFKTMIDTLGRKSQLLLLQLQKKRLKEEKGDDQHIQGTIFLFEQLPRVILYSLFSLLCCLHRINQPTMVESPPKFKFTFIFFIIFSLSLGLVSFSLCVVSEIKRHKVSSVFLFYS